MYRMVSIVRGCAAALPFVFASAAGTAAPIKTIFGFNSADGSFPGQGLIADPQGNFYGVTVTGGANEEGVIFKLTPQGQQSVLYSFCSVVDQSGDCLDGSQPNSRLVADSQGNLYGTTDVGGAQSAGTVFKLSPQGQETVLYSFCSVLDQSGACADGNGSNGGLILDAQGNLYGTTVEGGANNAGTVFQVTPQGQETVLYSFCSQAHCNDGQFPTTYLIMDAQGDLYGETSWGGTGGCQGGYNVVGCGTVFELTPQGVEMVLYSFQGGGDGRNAYGGLLADGQGNLYGTTLYGGGGANCVNGCGTVFKLTPQGAEAPLYAFQAYSDGAYPASALIADARGNLYGTAGSGQIFEVTPQGQESATMVPHGDFDGNFPLRSDLIADPAGHLYGVSTIGAEGYGTVFEDTDKFRVTHLCTSHLFGC